MGSFYIGRHILTDQRTSCDKGMGANPNELLYGGKAREYNIIANGNVACQRRIIGKDAIVADHTIMRDMGIGHDQAVAPDRGLVPVGVNSVGLKRRGFSLEKINHILDIYRILFVRGYNVSKALSIIETEIPVSDERDEIITFVRETGRGIMKGYSRRLNEDLA